MHHGMCMCATETIWWDLLKQNNCSSPIAGTDTTTITFSDTANNADVYAVMGVY